MDTEQEHSNCLQLLISFTLNETKSDWMKESLIENTLW